MQNSIKQKVYVCFFLPLSIFMFLSYFNTCPEIDPESPEINLPFYTKGIKLEVGPDLVLLLVSQCIRLPKTENWTFSNKVKIPGLIRKPVALSTHTHMAPTCWNIKADALCRKAWPLQFSGSSSLIISLDTEANYQSPFTIIMYQIIFLVARKLLSVLTPLSKARIWMLDL